MIYQFGLMGMNFHINTHLWYSQQTCISPEPGAKANWQWGRVGWMFADHGDGLSSSSFKAWSSIAQSVSLSAGIQSAGDLVSETPGSNPAFRSERQLVSFWFKVGSDIIPLWTPFQTAQEFCDILASWCAAFDVIKKGWWVMFSIQAWASYQIR